MRERYSKDLHRFALRMAQKDPTSAEWWVVRCKIPQSWFTKRGPGVHAEARKTWNCFTKEQKAVAVERGWFPAGGPRG